MAAHPHRTAYQQGAALLVATAATVRPEQWDAPGLGEWTVRDLTGHASRALLIVEDFSHRIPERVSIPDSAAYYRAAFTGAGTNERIAERGRQSGRDLGPDPAQAVRAIAERVLARVDALPDGHPLDTMIGGIRLVDYLPSRTVELVVHSLDIAQATGQTLTLPREALRVTLHLLAELAVDSPHAGALALAATSRPVPSFNVLG